MSVIQKIVGFQVGDWVICPLVWRMSPIVKKYRLTVPLKQVRGQVMNITNHTEYGQVLLVKLEFADPELEIAYEYCPAKEALPYDPEWYSGRLQNVSE